MNKMQKVDRIFLSSFDTLVEGFFQKPMLEGLESHNLPMNTIGDYIDLYKEKRSLETRMMRLKEQMLSLTDELRAIEIKEMELKRNEESLLVEKSNLKEACASKSLFLANMSHEIRTPMNGVVGTLEILKETDLTPDQRKYLGIIETCAHTLLAVVDDVLDYSKIEANELKIDTVDFNLKEIVSQVRDILISKAQEKRIEFTTHIVHNVPIWLKGDPLRIRQILLNLGSNAVKFSDRGTVAIEVNVLKETVDSVLLHFKVKDNGIGISREQQQYLFQSYSQINPEITRKFGGTGLGLAISKKLTELMKGKIGVNSKKNKGSEFWFSIPFRKQLATRKHESDLVRLVRRCQAVTKVKKRELTLLLVEDDVINQKINSILLEKEGFNVSIAENGKKAIETLKTRAFDLVLMDVEMPGINGYDTTRKIRQSKTNLFNTNIPIVAMTAHAMTGDREKCLAAGMNDYIAKPINMHLLNDIINRLKVGKSSSRAPVDEGEAQSSTASAIELDKLENLREDVEEKFDLLVLVYLESIPKKLSGIYQAIEEQRFEDLGIIAHQLKGSSASFYAQNLVKICQILETMAIQPGVKEDDLRKLAGKLEKEAAQVIRILNDRFRN